MALINQSERAAYGIGFAKEEVIETESNGMTIVTVYGAHAPSEDASDDDPKWSIQKTIVVMNGNTTEITERWAEGAWSNRENLTYKYK